MARKGYLFRGSGDVTIGPLAKTFTNVCSLFPERHPGKSLASRHRPDFRLVKALARGTHSDSGGLTLRKQAASAAIEELTHSQPTARRPSGPCCVWVLTLVAGSDGVAD